MKQSAELEKIYRDAQAIIDRRGWCQLTYENPSGECCIVAGIRLAQGLSADPFAEGYVRVWTEAERELANLTESISLIGTPTLEKLNNYVLRSKEEVLGLLDLAADLAAPSP